MCGIAGILRVHPPGTAVPPALVAIPESWLDILDESIKHRGPDGQGRFRDRAVRADGTVVDVALVHRRMAVIDLADGVQPMVSPRGALKQDLVSIVFNGCVYNHRELRKELQAAGHEFVSDHSDTEVMIHGWRQWRSGVFERADGMFGLGLWDRGTASLHLARDAFGEKPLYLLQGTVGADSITAFSSCVPGLARVARIAGIKADANSPAFSQIKPWVQFGWNQGRMPVGGITEILPGQCRHFPETEAEAAGSVAPWLNEVLNPDHRRLDVDSVDALVRAAVESRLEADVPLGCFLSGGIDSSLLAAFASRARPDIEAFTVRMPDPSMDESQAAAAVSRHLGMRHTVLDCDARPSEDLPRLIMQLGLPFGDSSLLPTYWVSRAARGAIRVAIAGDGGDELFCGYDRHRAIKWLTKLDRLPEDARRGLAESLVPGGRPKSRLDRLARLFNAAAHNGYKDLIAIFPPPLDAALGLTREGYFGFQAIHHWGMTATGPAIGAPQSRAERAEFLERLALRFDRLFYLPCDLLRKTDSASMSVALEVRAPMLEARLSRAAINAPMASLMPGGQRKGLLRAVARKYLPAEIVDRPKQGFAIPIGDWFRSDYGGMKQLLMDHLSSANPWGPASLGIDLNMKFVRQMLDEHMGTGMSGRVVRDHSQRLYMLLVLSIWAKWMGSV